MTTKSPFTTKIYDQEYFSASQMNIYIGDVLVDEVTSLSMTVQENKRPWYGYASPLFDAVSKGTVIVQGQFSINYKETGYLFNVLTRYKERVGSHNRVLPWVAQGQGAVGRGAKRYSTNGVTPGSLTRNNIETTQWIENLTQNGKPGNRLTIEQQQAYYQHLSGFNNPGGALGPTEDIFERFEDAIWGTESPPKETRLITHQKYNDFNIIVTYGDFNRNDRVNHSVKEIQNIHITSQSQMVDNDGNPIQEIYQFFARNIV